MDFLSDPDNVDLYLTGFSWILRLTGAGALGALVLGVILAGMRVSPVPVLRAFGAGWVNTFRNTPLTLIIFFCYFGLYSTLGLTLDSEDIALNNFWLGVLGLSVYTAAFVCEAIRSGINTVPPGQAEAARALGLSFFQVLRIIVLPQAGRAVIAPLGSIFIALAKNSTIVGTIGLAESSSAMKTMIETYSSQTILIFLLFAGTFAAVLIPTGYFFGWLANRLAVKR
ncbi:amino acid ABC transporter permease [Catenuloplanes atrovinosus]|uniref:Glutamate transport system permease protein n=1 Tax=Catenuloplanes atrovinosus TaxID=137266 RepID=A0AAE4C865_9ACTN|nr:amino acid ABC transporter permease [Catenuloplanes atrovinosus]MDR7273449.1 glutamate transport system permease protein [Catenuloplanes atrovinosus]